MKLKFNFFGLLACMLLMTACADQKIVPETTKVSGELGDCFTVEERDYSLKTGDGSSTLTVAFTRTDAALPFKGESSTIGSFLSKKSIKVGFGIELLDEEGNVLSKIPADKPEKDEYANIDECVDLVKLPTGEKGTIEFRMPADENLCKKIAKFRITSAFEAAQTLFFLSGAVKTYPVHMVIDLEKKKGAYYYNKYGANHSLEIVVHEYNPDNGELTMTEYNDMGVVTGEFIGVINEDGYKGHGEFLGKPMPFDMKQVDKASASWPEIKE